MGALVLMRMVGRSGVKISILDVLARSQLAVLIASRSTAPGVSK